MSQINRPPFGLQYLFGSKNFGVNPNELVQQVVPQVDLAQFMLGELLQGSNQNTVVTGVGQSSTVTVPDNELWRVVSIFIAITSASGGEFFYIECQLNPPRLGQYISLGSVTKDTSSAGQYGYGFQVHLPEPLMCLPGTEIRGTVMETNITSITLSTDVLYYRLEM